MLIRGTGFENVPVEVLELLGRNNGLEDEFTDLDFGGVFLHEGEAFEGFEVDEEAGNGRYVCEIEVY